MEVQMPAKHSKPNQSNLQPSLFDFSSNDETKIPAPLLVADKFDFDLPYIAGKDGRTYYRLRSWVTGCTDESSSAKTIRNMRDRGVFSKVAPPDIVMITEVIAGQSIEFEYVTDSVLYICAQELRSTKKNPVVQQVKDYLVACGVLVDELRTEKRGIAPTFGAAKALESAMSDYDKQGKSKQWQAARAVGIIDRNSFTKALNDHVSDLNPKYHFAEATNAVYKGLWNRDASQLRNELNLSKKNDLRDHQTTWGLHYQGLVESTIAHYLENEETVSFYAAKRIIEDVSAVFGIQSNELANRLGFDLATGRPLLKSRT
jgi:hypothetical protein